LWFDVLGCHKKEFSFELVLVPVVTPATNVGKFDRDSSGEAFYDKTFAGELGQAGGRHYPPILKGASHGEASILAYWNKNGHYLQSGSG